MSWLEGQLVRAFSKLHIPDGEDTTSLGKVGLLLDTANSLLKDGRNLGGRGLGVGGVGSESVDGCGCGISSLRRKELAEARKSHDQMSSDNGDKQLEKAHWMTRMTIQLLN